MESARASTFKVGDWYATRALNLLERDGHSIQIEPRAMDVLGYLATHAGEVISVDELIASVWHGHVSDGSVYRIINHLRQALESDHQGARYIQTIPKRGYRLIADVSFQSEQLGPVGKRQRVDRREVPRLVQRPSYIFAASVVLIILGVVVFRGMSNESQIRDIERRPTESPVAYSLYLKSFVSETNAESRHLLDQALELDPSFALAHVWKARRFAFDLITDDEAALIETERLIQEDAERALELDPNLGYAYVALAELHSRHWREAEALAAFEQAIQLSPNNVEVLISFAFFDNERGQNQQAIEKAQAAVLLDPNNLRTHLRLGGAYLFAKDPDLVASVDLDFINRFPPDPWAYLALGFLELMRGSDSDVLTNISIAEQLLGDVKHAGFFARLAYAYSRIGRLDDASRVLGELEAMGSSGQRVGPAQFGFANLAAGNLEESLAWFNTAAETRDTPSGGNWITAVMKQNTFSDPLLDQPEWVQVRNRLGFR
jgi:DNA-binding winged helix-turn-helix (wHTH) protein/tetratricopeptide (TPR) repeat protein